MLKKLVRTIFALGLCGLAVWSGLRIWGVVRQKNVMSQIASREDIPQSLLDLAERNSEAANFVAGYPGSGPAEPTTLEVTAGQVPLLLQWDERWGYEIYGDDYMAVTGCAPTCLSMVAAGLTGNGELSPLYMAGLAQQGGYYTPGTGTSWDFMTDGPAQVGLYASEISLSQGSIDAWLSEGGAVICSVRPGDFTTAGHFIVLAGYTDNGSYRVYDPNSPERSAKGWSYEQLEPQIKNLWGYSLG